MVCLWYREHADMVRSSRVALMSSWTVRRIATPILLLTLVPVVMLSLLIATSSVASAHAKYVSSAPAAGAVLAEAPGTVSITFAEAVDPTASGIAVYDASMKQVSSSTVSVDPSNAKVMHVPMQGDGSEVYVVV